MNGNEPTPKAIREAAAAWKAANPPGDQRQEGEKPARIEQDPDGNWIASPPAEAAAAKLQAFKDYVHQRLDAMGVPVDPESPHKAEGCRIGGRLDYIEAALASPTGVDEAMVERAEAYMLRVLPGKSTECLGGRFNFYDLLAAALAARDGGAKA